MNCFYDFKHIKKCIKCENEFKYYTECDNSCGSFTCEKCNCEFYAQYTNNLKLKDLEKMIKLNHKIIETKKGFIIILENHNPMCGEFD